MLDQFAILVAFLIAARNVLINVVIGYLFPLQMRVSDHSKWEIGEACIWFTKPFSCPSEDCPRSDCKGWLFYYSRTGLCIRCILVHKGNCRKVCHLYNFHTIDSSLLVASQQLILKRIVPFRFVRFVSTPEVLERVTTIESEILQIEEAICIQGNESLGLSTVSIHFFTLFTFGIYNYVTTFFDFCHLSVGTPSNKIYRKH